MVFKMAKLPLIEVENGVYTVNDETLRSMKRISIQKFRKIR